MNWTDIKGGFVRLYSDNFDGQILTGKAYREALFGMSTGEFHTHKVKRTTAKQAKRYGYIGVKQIRSEAVYGWEE